MKKFLLIATLILVLFALLACTGQDADETDTGTPGTAPPATGTDPVTAAPTDEIVEIRFQWWGDTVRHDRYFEIIELFHETYPNIRVIAEPASWGDFWTRLATQTGGGNPAEVFGMHPQFVSDYALRGVLADLGPFVDQGLIDISHISDSVINGSIIDGYLIGIPKGITFQALGANRLLAERFGIDIPDRFSDWTWEEFYNQAVAFMNAVDGQDYQWIPNHVTEWVYFRWFARQAGGDIYTPDAMELGFEEETLIYWFDFWARLQEIGAVPQDPSVTIEQAQMPWQQRRFANGITVFNAIPANQLSLFQAQAEETDIFFDMVRVPRALNEPQRAENLELPMKSISSQANEAEARAAAIFINFWLNTEASMEIFQLEHGVAPNQAMGEHITPLLTAPAIRTMEFVEAMLDEVQAGVYPPLGAQEINSLFANIGEMVLFGMLSPEEAARQFIDEANDILERNRE